jgi:hypothetical protein
MLLYEMTNEKQKIQNGPVKQILSCITGLFVFRIYG